MIIPKEKVQQFQRWQVTDFDTPARPMASPPPPPEAPTPYPPAPAVEPPPALTQPAAEEIEQIYETARAEGYQAGFASGETAAKDAADSALAERAGRLEVLTHSLQEALKSADQTVAEQLLGLSIDIAEQLIRGKLSVNREFMLPVVREAINALPIHHAHILLRVHPDDFPIVKKGLGESFFQAGNQLIEDHEISPGGCLLNAGASEIDATLETRWKRVLEPLGASAHEWLTP